MSEETFIEIKQRVEGRDAISLIEKYGENTELAIKACVEVGFDLEKILQYQLRGFALAEETFYEMAGLKHGLTKFVASIQENIIDSPIFPENMRMMARMLIENSSVVRDMRDELKQIGKGEE